MKTLLLTTAIVLFSGNSYAQDDTPAPKRGNRSWTDQMSNSRTGEVVGANLWVQGESAEVLYNSLTKAEENTYQAQAETGPNYKGTQRTSKLVYCTRFEVTKSDVRYSCIVQISSAGEVFEQL